jgi:hypothetical protein
MITLASPESRRLLPKSCQCLGSRFQAGIESPTFHYEFPREGHGYVPMLRAAGEAILNDLLEHPWHTWTDSLEVARLLDSLRRYLDTVQPNIRS